MADTKISGLASGGAMQAGDLVPIARAGANYSLTGTAIGAFGPQGTVTSVGGTGTVNGLTLTGTVTATGNLTLGGTLDLSSPPAIGGTTPAAGAFTTLSATSTVSGAGFTSYLASPPAIGGTAAANVTGTTVTATTQFSGPGTGLSGTAASLSVGGSAATLTTGRTIAMTGDVAWTSPAFNGSANVTAAGTIQAGAVTLAKMASLAANSIIGNNTGAGATPIALTQTQVTAMINAFTSVLSGAVPASGGGTTNFLRADGTWAAAGGGSPGGSTTQIQYNSAGSFAGASGITTTGTELAIAPAANAVPLTVSGYSLTGANAQALLDLLGTWNTTGTPTLIKANITITASNASSLLMDLQKGGTSQFKLGLNGEITNGNSGMNNITAINSIVNSGNGAAYAINGTAAMLLSKIGGLAGVFITGGIGLGTNVFTAQDAFLTRRGAANLRFGDADAAAPVAQTLSVQSVVAGTSNTAGQNLTITGSQGTGTGAGGDIKLQVALPGSTGSTQNALVNAVGLSGTTGAFGYITGIGGTVTQATSRTTGVTLNKPAGAITLVSAAGLATWQTFTLTNSAISATDTVIVNQKSGTDLYMISVTAVGTGSCNISFATTGGVTTEQPVFNFVVVRGATS